MKSAIILLFVLVSLIGINEAFANPTHNSNILVDMTPNEVEITLEFPLSDKCAISIEIQPNNQPVKFRGHYSYYPSVATFNNGLIFDDTFGGGVTYYPYEVVECNTPLTIPINQFNGQSSISFYIFAMGWTGDTYNPLNVVDHGRVREIYSAFPPTLSIVTIKPVPSPNGTFSFMLNDLTDNIQSFYTINAVNEFSATPEIPLIVGHEYIVTSLDQSVGFILVDSLGCMDFNDFGVLLGTPFIAQTGQYVVCAFLFNTSEPPKSSEGNSNNNKDRTPPTLGLNDKHERIVDNGLTFGGIKINVVHEYTEFPLIKMPVGALNTIDLLIYENWGKNNIKFVHVFLGLEDKTTPISKAAASFGYHFLPSNSVREAFEITDKQNLLDSANMTGISSAECSIHDNTNYDDCLKISFEYTSREAPLHNVFAIQLGDEHGNKFTHYFNDGIAVIGDSLNPTRIETISGIEYTRIDKANNIWESDDIQYKMLSPTLMERITPSYPTLQYLPRWLARLACKIVYVGYGG